MVLFLVRGSALGKYIDDKFGLRAAKTRPLISIVTHGEVRVMARRNNWSAPRLQALQAALDSLVTVDISHPLVLDAYVEVDLFSQGQPLGARNMGKNDLWIAASAKAAQATLITTDDDFDHLNTVALPVEKVNPSIVKVKGAT